MCKLNAYTVWGDMTSDKSSENYPLKNLCEECAANYEVISVEAPFDKYCEDCGCEDISEELENRKEEIEEEISKIEEKITELETELNDNKQILVDLQKELEDINSQL